jgi:NADH:ubiquinone oxidoreductase subunit 5 (subunit L)/multisubunit Na+/H+ antiporter MnhA subunit
MEAPVPASALIHSATLVSAGVFLILRLSPIFEISTYSFYLLGIIGSFTAFFGGCCAAYQSDIKRILAYSTISHCGFLMVTCLTKIPELTILYLYVHGFFKAAVFLCIGNVIRFSYNYQDFRRMGNLKNYLPFECFFTFICLFNLCGLPFSMGYYIKHILFIFLEKQTLTSYFIFIFILGGAISGLFYSSRIYYSVFFDFKKGKKYMFNHTNRSYLNK